MMTGITYELTVDGKDSECYYRDVASFTERVLLHGEALAGPLVEQLRLHDAAAAPEASRSKREYLLELLVLGTLWRIYARTACAAPQFTLHLLSVLTSIRQRNNCFKSGADLGRGILLTYCLAKEALFRSAPEAAPAPTVENLKKLLRWLKATGEFSQEAKRLHSWQDYLIKQTAAAVAAAIEQAVQFAAWFENASLTELGQYTGNVGNFLAEKRLRHRLREDYLLCGRQRVEYHLNMVGAEILNRAYRADFLTKKRRALILPSCMRSHSGRECRGYQGLLGLECQGCDGSCRVHRITRLGAEYHFEVYVIPHESSMFDAGIAQPGIKENMGVIGVACVLNLLGGGWKVKDWGIPPQCVLLNCCGCKKHWLDQDLPPDIDINQLLKVLDHGGHRNKNVS